MFTYGDSGLLAENLSYAGSYPKCKGTEDHLFFFFFFLRHWGHHLARVDWLSWPNVEFFRIVEVMVRVEILPIFARCNCRLALRKVCAVLRQIGSLIGINHSMWLVRSMRSGLAKR